MPGRGRAPSSRASARAPRRGARGPPPRTCGTRRPGGPGQRRRRAGRQAGPGGAAPSRSRSPSPRPWRTCARQARRRDREWRRRPRLMRMPERAQTRARAQARFQTQIRKRTQAPARKRERTRRNRMPEQRRPRNPLPPPHAGTSTRTAPWPGVPEPRRSRTRTVPPQAQASRLAKKQARRGPRRAQRPSAHHLDRHLTAAAKRTKDPQDPEQRSGESRSPPRPPPGRTSTTHPLQHRADCHHQHRQPLHPKRARTGTTPAATRRNRAGAHRAGTPPV